MLSYQCKSESFLRFISYCQYIFTCETLAPSAVVQTTFSHLHECAAPRSVFLSNRKFFLFDKKTPINTYILSMYIFIDAFISFNLWTAEKRAQSVCCAVLCRAVKSILYSDIPVNSFLNIILNNDTQKTENVICLFSFPIFYNKGNYRGNKSISEKVFP